MIKNPPSNNDDYIDSRDIEERINDLESARDDFQSENDLPDYLNTEAPQNQPAIIKNWTDEQAEKWGEWDDSDDGQELKVLLSLRDDLEGYCDDWRHGVTLIRESAWIDYCKDLVSDLGALPRDLPEYIAGNINWEGVAEDLQQDYTSAEFDGVTYWAR